MSEIGIVYSLVSLAGFYSAVRSVVRFFMAQDATERRKAVFSLLSAIIYVTICGATIYVNAYESFSWWAIVAVSCVLLLLNEVVLWKILRIETSKTV